MSDLINRQPDHTADIGKKVSISCTHENDLIFRKVAIDALARMMPRSYTPDGSHPADEGIFRAQEIFADCIEALEILPSAQPEKQHGRIFQEIIVVEYPSCNPYPERKGKPYFLIKYTENGQEFIGYGTYKPEVLSEYLKEDFMPSAQPEQKWIPCSERVPDNYDYQLLTEEVHYTTGKIVRCVLIAYYDDEDDVWMSAEESPEAISYPIAWMPLPEAYEGGDPE